MNKLTSYFNRVLSCEIEIADVTQRSAARTLYLLHLTFILVSAVYVVLCSIGIHDSRIPIFLPFVVALLFLIVFKIFKNFTLSGNLVCVGYYLLSVMSCAKNGGIYSDDMVWIGLTPVIAFLFINLRGGVVWSVIYIGTIVVFYSLSINNDEYFLSQSKNHDGQYYMVSWIFLFSILYSIVYLFLRDKFALVETLLKNKQELTRQRDEVRGQTMELQRKEKKLIQLNGNLEHFTYAVSHDLKEPLRTIKSYTQLINRKLRDHFDEDDRLYMNFVIDGATQMSNLLDDLLEYSRISEVHRDFQPIDLNDVILLVVNNLNKKVKESLAEIEVQTNLPLVNGTQSLLVIVMQNLISNAIKFRKLGKIPKIKIFHKEEGSSYAIYVKDNGIGIADEYQEKVFQIFKRLHLREEYEGSGIGLATCGKIVSSLGGEISLSSVLGEGTTIKITLPKTDTVLKNNNEKHESSHK